MKAFKIQQQLGLQTEGEKRYVAMGQHKAPVETAFKQDVHLNVTL